MILLVVICFEILFYFDRKKVEKIKLKESEFLTKEDKKLVEDYPNIRFSVVSLCSLQLFFAFIFNLIFNRLEAIYDFPFDIIIIIATFNTLSIILAIIITNFRLTYRKEYDFSKENVLSNRKYFRLKLWNYIMYKPNRVESTNKKDDLIYIRDIIRKNRELIDYNEYDLFKKN